MSGNRMIAALLASLLLPARVWAAEEPPIVNPSFEQAGDKGEPVGWTLWQREARTTAMALDATSKADGERSLKVTCTGKRDWAVSQSARVKATRGQVFRLSGWMRAEGVSMASIHAIHYSPENKLLNWFVGDLRTKDTHDWKFLDSTFRVPSDGAIVVRLMGSGPGVTWFDGLKLEERATGRVQSKDYQEALKARKVPLKFVERAGLERRDSPLTFGLPFPQAALPRPEGVRLLDEAGREIPAQIAPLAQWKDGSIKWLLVDTQASCRPNASQAATLDFSGAAVTAAPPASAQLAERDDGLAAQVGPLSFRVPKDSFQLLDQVRLGQATWLAGLGFEIATADGRTFGSFRDAPTLAIEENGPLRACARATGWHRADNGDKGFAYSTRIHAFAGQPFVRVLYTFTNTLDANWTMLSGVTLKLRPLFKVQRVTFGGDFGEAKRVEVGLSAGESVRLSQDEESVCRVTKNAAGGESPMATGRAADGWATLSGDGKTVSVAVKDFRQNFPMAYVVTADALEVHLLAPQIEPFHVARGASKTYEMGLAFGADAPAPMALREPLVAIAPPFWHVESGVHGNIHPSDVARFPFVEDLTAARFESILRSSRLLGWVNWGDIRYTNTEVDYHHGLFLQFMRTGDPQYLDWALPMARHSSDLDIRHYDTDAEKVGGGIRHRDHYDQTEPPKGTYNHTHGSLCASHTWLEGYLDAYFLTGDRRYIEVARAVGDWLVGEMTNEKHPGGRGGRESGRAVEQLTGLYLATLDERYLRAARKVVDLLLEIQQGDGSWFSFGQNVKGRRRQATRYDRGGHCSGVISSGLKSYHEATGDERVLEPFLAGVDFMMWEAMTDEQDSFFYGTTQGDFHEKAKYQRNRRVADPFTTTHMLENLAYAYTQTFDKDYLNTGLRCLNALVEKKYVLPNMQVVYGSQFLSLLAAEGVSLTTIPATWLKLDVAPNPVALKPGEKAALKVAVTNAFPRGVTGELSLELPAAGGLSANQPVRALRLERPNAVQEERFEVSAARDAAPGEFAVKALVKLPEGKVEKLIPVPFRPREEFDGVAPKLGEACAGIEPFEVQLREFQYFQHGRGSCTLWLAPEPQEPLVRLQEALWRVVPDCDDVRRHERGFTPHLSVGQVRGVQNAEALAAQLRSRWQPIAFTVREFSLIFRHDPPDDIFRVAWVVSLKPGTVAGRLP